jgi:hypothetical protein
MTGHFFNNTNMHCKLCKTMTSTTLIVSIVKSKAIPVTGREGPQGCETLRVTHYLDNKDRNVTKLYDHNGNTVWGSSKPKQTII